VVRRTIGDCVVTVLDAGTLWLDGGAMFGVVPKPLWERERTPDPENRIELSMNVLLIEDGRGRTLVDTGAGAEWSEKERGIYRLAPRSPDEILAPAGLRPEQIDRVIVTHLHFDHAGGNTVTGPCGERLPAYANAEYVLQSGEIETARRKDNERIRASYVPDHFEPLLAESGRCRTVEGDVALTPAIRLRLAPGHTPHMQIVEVRGGAETFAFLADLVPTSSHLRLPYVMGYDLEPLATLETKRRVLREAVEQRWTVVFEHDRTVPVARLAERDGRMVTEPVTGE
jgi:glyoxylase-like metal-dependent hydrolase (beta-lactamase superfamily II)